jgi:hypothetical protein
LPAAADVNGDGRPDLAAANIANNVSVLLDARLPQSADEHRLSLQRDNCNSAVTVSVTLPVTVPSKVPRKRW